MQMTFRPIDRWDRPETADRGYSPFRSTYAATLDLLDLELRQLDASQVILQVDATERDCRRDGQLRTDAKVRSPRVILAFRSMHGPLKYYCDRYVKWQDNLRAIALGLEALRRVERYGIGSRGEQYRGYIALPSGVALGPSTMTPREAAELLVTTAGHAWRGDVPIESCTDDLLNDVEVLLPEVWKYAARIAHPDQGGDVEAFKRISLARDVLKPLVND